MAAVPLSNYLVYSSVAKENVGRPVYIDPSLLATFTECVDPTCEIGRKLALQIQQDLSRLLEMPLSFTLILVVSIREVSACFIAFCRPNAVKTVGGQESISMISSGFRIILQVPVLDFSI